MTYKIFMSYSSEDKKLADVIDRNLNNAFNTNLSIFYAADEIIGGELWKSRIQEGLNTSDAIISLFTPNSIAKPWLYIEWSAFWINNKKYFLLLADGVKWQDLIHPMQDTQIINLHDLESVKNFYKALASESKVQKIPFSNAKIFYEEIDLVCKEQRFERETKEYNEYLNKLDFLPESDAEKEKIAEYFCDKGETEKFIHVVKNMRDDSVKTSYAIQLVKKGELECASEIAEKIQGNERLVDIAKVFIDYKFEETKELKDILESLSINNQTEFKKVIVYMMDRGMQYTPLFSFMKRKLINHAEIRKIAIRMITKGNYKEPLFMELINKIRKINQPELFNVLMALKDVDFGYFRELIENGIITNHDLLDELRTYLNDPDEEDKP